VALVHRRTGGELRHRDRHPVAARRTARGGPLQKIGEREVCRRGARFREERRRGDNETRNDAQGDQEARSDAGFHRQIIIASLRFDEESRVFEISVRELAEDEGFRRVGFDRGDGWRRLGLGSQIHSRVLGERQNTYPAYRCEVHLEARIPVEDWTAVLTGRLDGCIEREPGHWLIEELKSTNFSFDGVRPSGYAFERDRRQLLGYCYLWRRLGHGRDPAR